MAVAGGFALGLAAHADPAAAGTVRCLAFSTFDVDTDAGNRQANSRGWLRFSAPGAEINHLTVVGRQDGGWNLTDAAATVRIGRPGARERTCARRDAKTITAPASSRSVTSPTLGFPRTAFSGYLGAGDDRIAVSFGATGLDTRGLVDGQAGDDTIVVHGGSARLRAAISGGAGADRITVDWPHAPAPIREACQGHIRCWYRNHTLTVNGGPGNDSIEVSSPTAVNRQLLVSPQPAGGATAHQQKRQFRINGGAGDDTLRGNAGPDALYGGAGNDRLEASGGGADWLSGGPGDDVIVLDPASDPATVVDCGRGQDVLYLSGSHPAAVTGCETIVD